MEPELALDSIDFGLVVWRLHFGLGVDAVTSAGDLGSEPGDEPPESRLGQDGRPLPLLEAVDLAGDLGQDARRVVRDLAVVAPGEDRGEALDLEQLDVEALGEQVVVQAAFETLQERLDALGPEVRTCPG